MRMGNSCIANWLCRWRHSREEPKNVCAFVQHNRLLVTPSLLLCAIRYAVCVCVRSAYINIWKTIFLPLAHFNSIAMTFNRIDCAMVSEYNKRKNSDNREPNAIIVIIIDPCGWSVFFFFLLSCRHTIFCTNNKKKMPMFMAIMPHTRKVK